MDENNPFPHDPTQCHELLLAAYQQARQLEQQVATSQRDVAELNRVLDQTADSMTNCSRITLRRWKNSPGTSVGCTDDGVNELSKGKANGTCLI